MSKSSQWLLLTGLGVLIISPDSLLIRLVNISDFSLIFYRSYLQAVPLFLFCLFIYRRNTLSAFLAIGIPGIVYALLCVNVGRCVRTACSVRTAVRL